MQGTRRATGYPSLLRGGGEGALNQTKEKQAQQKHSSKMLLQKSAGLARIPLQNETWHQASISEHPPPPSVPPFDPVPGGHRVGRQSTLHAPTTAIVSQT